MAPWLKVLVVQPQGTDKEQQGVLQHPYHKPSMGS